MHLKKPKNDFLTKKMNVSKTHILDFIKIIFFWICFISKKFCWRSFLTKFDYIIHQGPVL